MTFFLVDDNLAFHRKVEAAGNPAMGLWVRAGAWCSQQLTDGHIPSYMIRKLGTKGQAETLVTVGLWHAVEDGYVFHQWSGEGRQRTRAEVEKRRAERAAAGRAGGQRSGETRRSKAEATASPLVEPMGLNPTPRHSKPNQETPPPTSSVAPPATPIDGPDLIDSAPDAIVASEPTRRGIEVGRETGRKQPSTAQSTTVGSAHKAPTGQRGTRLPEDFAPTPSLVAWARSKAPGVPASEHEAFVDYWLAKPDPDGRKVDWEATWRTWMRRAQADITAGRRAPAGGRRSTTDERVAQARSLRAGAEALDAAEATLTLVPALEGAS